MNQWLTKSNEGRNRRISHSLKRLHTVHTRTPRQIGRQAGTHARIRITTHHTHHDEFGIGNTRPNHKTLKMVRIDIGCWHLLLFFIPPFSHLFCSMLFSFGVGLLLLLLRFALFSIVIC